MTRLYGTTVCLVLAATASLQAWAGRDRLRLPNAAATPCAHYHHHGHGDAEAEAVVWLFIGMAYGGLSSAAYMEDRELGDSLLPLFRVETNYLYDDARRGAYGSMVEAGWGPIGGRLNHWDHFDVTTDDHVAMTTWHLMYRMTFGDTVELDLGAGGIEIGGDRKSNGGSGIFGVRVRLDEHATIEYVRSWHDVETENYSEHDIAFRASFECFHLKLGYRHLGLPERDLKGPYAGFGITF